MNQQTSKHLPRGIIVDVLQSASKTKGKYTSKFKRVLLVGTSLPLLCEPDVDLPILKVIKNVFGETVAVPLTYPENIGNFSGNFLWLSHRSFPWSHPIKACDSLG